MKRLSLVVAVMLAGGATSCTNMIYYYQSEKIALSVETRQDSTQPVTGSFGFKQRIVTIVPPKDDVDIGVDEPASDAANLISYFDFGLKDPGGGGFDALDVRSFLITGDAADQVKQDDAMAVFETLALATAEGKTATWTAVKRLYDVLKTAAARSDDEQAFVDALNARSTALLGSVQAFKPWTRRKDAGGVWNVIEGTQQAVPAAGTHPFDDLSTYRGVLDGSVGLLGVWAKLDAVDGGTWKVHFDGAAGPVPGTDMEKVTISAALDSQSKTLSEIDDEILSNPVVRRFVGS